MPLVLASRIEMNAVERVFLEELAKQLVSSGYDPIYLRINRTSEQTLNFRLTGCQIGRIKLQGWKTKMQVLTADKVFWYEDLPFESYVGLIPRWMEYVRARGFYDPLRPWPW